MNKRIVFLVALVMLVVASAVVFAEVCYFSNGVTVSYSNSRTNGNFAIFTNEVAEGRDVPHYVEFTDGTKTQKQNQYVPANTVRKVPYSKTIKAVVQCW